MGQPVAAIEAIYLLAILAGYFLAGITRLQISFWNMPAWLKTLEGRV